MAWTFGGALTDETTVPLETGNYVISASVKDISTCDDAMDFYFAIADVNGTNSPNYISAKQTMKK